MTLGTARAMLAEPGNYSADQLARARAVAAHWARVRKAQAARQGARLKAAP
jgi:hypothetical protein